MTIDGITIVLVTLGIFLLIVCVWSLFLYRRQLAAHEQRSAAADVMMARWENVMTRLEKALDRIEVVKLDT